MPERTAEPLSPELILVSPPEEAALAREQLPELPATPAARRREAAPLPPNGASDVNWNEFLADVRKRPVEPVAPPRLRPPEPIRRSGRKRLIVVAAAIVAVAVVVGIAWARDRTQQQPASSAPSKPAPHRQATPPKSVKPAKHASSTPAPAVTTAAKPKPKATSKPKPTSKPKRPARTPAPHATGFVPTRVWSWAAVPGAHAYVVRFLRNGHNVLKIRTGGPRLGLPSGFSFAPGRYRWTVTTVSRNGTPGRVVVDSTFTVSAPNG